MGPHPPLRQFSSISAMHGHHVTEDTPLDMFEGEMELMVILPNRNRVNMTVHRSTPMMDLLIQVATAHKISPAGHVIHVVSDSMATYKPSTPIGTLDASIIEIVPKGKALELTKEKRVKAAPEKLIKTKEWVYRQQLVVHLPRHQLGVYRLAPQCTLREVLSTVCSDKDLVEEQMRIRLPDKLSTELDLSLTLHELNTQEVSVVHKDFKTPTHLSVGDLLAITRGSNMEEGKKKRGGVFKFFSRKPKSSTGDSSISSGSAEERSVSPSDESDVTTRAKMKKRKAPPAPALYTKIDQDSNGHVKENTYASSTKDVDRSDVSSICSNPKSRRKAPLPPNTTNKSNLSNTSTNYVSSTNSSLCSSFNSSTAKLTSSHLTNETNQNTTSEVHPANGTSSVSHNEDSSDISVKKPEISASLEDSSRLESPSPPESEVESSIALQVESPETCESPNPSLQESETHPKLHVPNSEESLLESSSELVLESPTDPQEIESSARESPECMSSDAIARIPVVAVVETSSSSSGSTSPVQPQPSPSSQPEPVSEMKDEVIPASDFTDSEVTISSSPSLAVDQLQTVTTVADAKAVEVVYSDAVTTIDIRDDFIEKDDISNDSNEDLKQSYDDDKTYETVKEIDVPKCNTKYVEEIILPDEKPDVMVDRTNTFDDEPANVDYNSKVKYVPFNYNNKPAEIFKPKICSMKSKKSKENRFNFSVGSETENNRQNVVVCNKKNGDYNYFIDEFEKELTQKKKNVVDSFTENEVYDDKFRYLRSKFDKNNSKMNRAHSMSSLSFSEHLPYIQNGKVSMSVYNPNRYLLSQTSTVNGPKSLTSTGHRYKSFSDLQNSLESLSSSEEDVSNTVKESNGYLHNNYTKAVYPDTHIPERTKTNSQIIKVNTKYSTAIESPDEEERSTDFLNTYEEEERPGNKYFSISTYKSRAQKTGYDRKLTSTYLSRSKPDLSNIISEGQKSVLPLRKGMSTRHLSDLKHEGLTERYSNEGRNTTSYYFGSARDKTLLDSSPLKRSNTLSDNYLRMGGGMRRALSSSSLTPNPSSNPPMNNNTPNMPGGGGNRMVMPPMMMGFEGPNMAQEYMKLQDDFFKWQDQLMQNQHVLHSRVAPIASNTQTVQQNQQQQQRQQQQSMVREIPIAIETESQDAGVPQMNQQMQGLRQQMMQDPSHPMQQQQQRFVQPPQQYQQQPSAVQQQKQHFIQSQPQQQPIQRQQFVQPAVVQQKQWPPQQQSAPQPMMARAPGPSEMPAMRIEFNTSGLSEQPQMSSQVDQSMASTLPKPYSKAPQAHQPLNNRAMNGQQHPTEPQVASVPWRTTKVPSPEAMAPLPPPMEPPISSILVAAANAKKNPSPPFRPQPVETKISVAPQNMAAERSPPRNPQQFLYSPQVSEDQRQRSPSADMRSVQQSKERSPGVVFTQQPSSASPRTAETDNMMTSPQFSSMQAGQGQRMEPLVQPPLVQPVNQAHIQMQPQTMQAPPAAPMQAPPPAPPMQTPPPPPPAPSMPSPPPAPAMPGPPPPPSGGPPPPPPPSLRKAPCQSPPVEGPSSSGERKNSQLPGGLDPRDELMMAIRSFGGTNSRKLRRTYGGRGEEE